MNARPAIRFAAVVALVLLVHNFAVSWFAVAMDHVPFIQPMVTPMFTRVLQQEAAAPPAPPSAAGAIGRKETRAAVSAAPAKPLPPASSPTPEPPSPGPEKVAIAPAVESAPALPAASAAVAAASSPGASNLDSWPADTRLNYRLTGWYRGEVNGRARVQWQRQQERYQARIEIEIDPFITLTMTSQGEVVGQGLSPRLFEELRQTRARSVRLEADAVVLGDGRRLPRPAAVQDTASQFVELSHRFSTGKEKLEVGRSTEVWLARPGGVDLWTYDIVEREILQTRDLGAIEAFHLKPRAVANPRGNINAEMWFAPSLQYLPVRIRINMGADTFVDLMVDKIEQR